MPSHLSKIIPPGTRFDRLTVCKYAFSRPPEGRFYRCICDCGNETTVRGARLTNGQTRSCGCLRDERRRIGNLKHGGARANAKHPLYSTWQGIRLRCRNPNSRGYPWYGGRGITMDPRWDDFAVFARDMGSRPGPGYTVHRKDPDGPYSPENCRWATWNDQRREQRARPLTNTTHVQFDVELTAVIDSVRGEQSRGDWVRDLVRRAAS